MSALEIIVAIVLIGMCYMFINYIVGLFSVLPSILVTYLSLALAISLIMFVIHRGK